MPDCRAYEKVSPAEKGGADAQGTLLGPNPGGFQAAVDGEAAIFTALNGVFAGSRSAPTTISYRAVRSPSGWVTRGIDPQLDVGYPTAVVEHPFYTPNLDAQVLFTETGLVGGSADGGMYRVGFEPESTAQITTGAGLGYVESVVASSDARTVAYTTTTSQGIQLYSGGALRQLGIPGGSGYRIGGGVGGGAAGTKTALSTDGSRLYFTAEASSPPEVYLYENGASKLVSEPNEGVVDPNGPKPATFSSASADGSRAFFTSAAKLTADATTGPNDEGSDLYEFVAAAPAGQRLKDLTTDPAETAGARVQTVLGGGESGDYIYFTALGKLAGDAVAGQTNLYVSHEGTTSFIAPVEPGELEQTPAFSIREKFGITGRGQAIVFQTTHEQPGYANAGHSEVYLYNAETGQLDCASCNPSGAPATANSTIGEETFYLFAGPRHQRNVNEAGTEVFFNSGEALVETDTNGQSDVYEYEGGAPHLISTGTGTQSALLLGSSADGRDVFFGTRQRLTAADQDEIVDVYDARRGGGLVEPIPGGNGCLGESTCRSAPSGSPSASQPGSSLLVGQGSQPPRKHRSKRHHRKKHHPKKHKAHQKHNHHKHRGKGKKAKHAPAAANHGGAK